MGEMRWVFGRNTAMEPSVIRSVEMIIILLCLCVFFCALNRAVRYLWDSGCIEEIFSHDESPVTLHLLFSMHNSEIEP